MPGISIHVVDVSRGVVASGMRVELFAVSGDAPRLIAAGSVSKTGVLADPALDRRFEPGFYEARFHIADYYRERDRCSGRGAVPRRRRLSLRPRRARGALSPADEMHAVGILVLQRRRLMAFRPASCMASARTRHVPIAKGRNDGGNDESQSSDRRTDARGRGLVGDAHRRAGLSEQARPHRRDVPAGRLERRHRARPLGSAAEGAWPAGGGRQQARRRRHHRRGRNLPRRARRLQPADVEHDTDFARAVHAQSAALRIRSRASRMSRWWRRSPTW